MIFIIVYAAGWLLCTWPVARRVLSYWHVPGDIPPDGMDRFGALFAGWVFAIIWPALLVFAVAARFLRSDHEVAEARDVELRELRALAKQYNLPMGDGS